MSVLHINPDSASRVPHEGCGAEVSADRRVHQAALHRCVRSTDDGLVEGLRQKAELLGSGTVRVHRPPPVCSFA